MLKDQGCARFGSFFVNSCAPYNSITRETFTPARCETVKIHRIEHNTGRSVCVQVSELCSNNRVEGSFQIIPLKVFKVRAVLLIPATPAERFSCEEPSGAACLSRPSRDQLKRSTKAEEDLTDKTTECTVNVLWLLFQDRRYCESC